MKNLIYILSILLFLVFVLSSCSTVSDQRKIIGAWNAGEKLSYVFDKNGYAIVRMGDQVIGGPDLFGNSALKYEIDYSKEPIALDLVHIDKSNNKERNRMAMIVKFLSDNKIQIKTFNNKNRPEKFEENDKSVFILNRDSGVDNKDKKNIKEKE